MLNGIDVSHYQGNVNWNAVKEAGITFAIAKSTGGITYVDPQFQTNWEGIKSAGLVRGTYHFLYAEDNAQDQANNFLKTVGSLDANDLPPFLDVEITDGADGTVITQNVLDWCNAVESALGRKPVIYTNESFGNTYFTDPEFSSYALWVAEYGVQAPTMPGAWSSQDWTLWQSSQSGTVSGVSGDVDLDSFNGSMTDLTNFIQGSSS